MINKNNEFTAVYRYHKATTLLKTLLVPLRKIGAETHFAK